uniref:CUE domain-containing protein n=1 Tax=Zea mays TaxID=4577 RepID=A0A804PUY6_MAIZE
MEGSFQLNPNASPFIPGLLGSSAQKAPEKQGGSSSKGEPSGSTFDPSEYEENDMDELALVKMVFSMFPNVSTDFIDELIKANDFDMNLTVDMLYELNSQDMVHDDSEVINHFHDDSEATNDLHDGKTVVPESSSNMNQDLQNEESATTSDVKSVLPKFSQINLLHNDLGLPDDDKSAGTSIAN